MVMKDKTAGVSYEVIDNNREAFRKIAGPWLTKQLGDKACLQSYHCYHIDMLLAYVPGLLLWQSIYCYRCHAGLHLIDL